MKMTGDGSGHAGWTAAVPPICLPLIIAAGTCLRWQHVRNYEFLLGGDDGVVALMGLHILRGREFPLVFYGQHYMGTLDAMAAALAFYWLGPSAAAYKLTVLLFAALALLLLGLAAWMLWGGLRACLAVGLFAFAPAAVRWQMDQPSYGLLFLFGAALLVVGIRLTDSLERRPEAWPRGAMCGWALLAGVGFWANSLVLSLALPLPFLLRLRGARPPAGEAALAAACLLFGMAPLVLHNVEHPLATLRQFTGFFLDVSSRSDVQDLSLWQVALRGLWHKVDPAIVPRNLLVAVGGYDLTAYPWLALAGYPAVLAFLALIGIALSFWAGRIVSLGWDRWIATREGLILIWLWLSLGLVFLLGSTRSRYMALLVLILPLLLAGRLPAPQAGWNGGIFRRLQGTLLAGLLLYVVLTSSVLNVVRPITVANPVPGLARFLESKGLTLGYAGFELAYPLAVHTREAVRVSPLAGPIIDDLYPAYTEAVEQVSSPFYIYEENEPLGKDLARYLRESGTKFEMTLVGHHLVFWGLSHPVKPDEFLSGSYLARYRQAHR